MAMATVIWAAAAEVIIMDGAEDAVIIVTITDTPQESTFGDLRRNRRCCGTLQFRRSCANDRFVPVKVPRCLGSLDTCSQSS